MLKNKSYEKFPIWIPLLAIVLSILTYITGAIILMGFSIIVATLYLIYCFGIEILVILRSCKHCYYYNKICGLGKGIFASLIVKKGDPKKFTEREVTISDLIPDFLVAIFPIVGGIILSIIDFSLIRVGMIILIMLLSIGGTAFIRGSFACKYCRQREIGCPAEQLFSTKKSS